MSSRNAPAATPGPYKPPNWASHLRQFSRTSLDRPADQQHQQPPPPSPDTLSSTSTIRDRPSSTRSRPERRWTVTVNESFARDEVLLNLDLLGDEVKAGSLLAIDVVKAEPEKQPQASHLKAHFHDRDRGRDAPAESEKRYICVAKDMPKDLKLRYPHVEVYVAKHIADVFGMRKGSQVTLTPVDASNPAIEASHIELSFKDQYLSRADMWRLAVKELSERTVYKGQFVQSAFFGRDTKPIFRSESARYVLFIQMAREMWDFDSDGSGEIIFNKVVNGFLPALFKKWAALKVKHLVSIVLFARVEYDTGISADLAGTAIHHEYYTGIQSSGGRRPYKDFYRVVVSDMASNEWTTILYQLKREFNHFRKDISTHHQKAMAPLFSTSEDGSENTDWLNRIKTEPSKAMYGNILEAINMASQLYAHDYIDRDLMRTGISVVVISASPGVFEVDYDSLRRTTEALVGTGIGIDLICVPKIPLHSVPLFRYRNPRHQDHPHHHHHKVKPTFSLGSTPKQGSSTFGSYTSISSSFSPSKGTDITIRGDSRVSTAARDEWCFALPQWLHVSYWTGASGEALSYHGIALSVSEGLQVETDEEFPIRCRMYDLQMRSVMETNEIETKPLHMDPCFPLKAVQSSRVHNPQLGPDGSVYIQNLRAPETLFDHVYGFQKFAPDKNSARSEKSLWKQLQEYDDSRARLPTSRRTPVHLRHARDHHEVSRQHVSDDSGFLSTSFTDRRPSLQARLTGLSTEYRPSANRLQVPQIRTRAPPEPPEAEPKLLSPTKPPKIIRQISLGFRGFGIAAPKAATAELSIETVGASKTAANAKTTPVKSAQRPSSPRKAAFGTPTGRVSPLSFAQGAQSPLDTPTRPIVIKSQSQSAADLSPGMTPGSMLSSTLRADRIGSDLDLQYSNAIRAEDAKKVYNSKLLAGALPELPSTLSPTAAISPWLTTVNPSNPQANDVDMSTLYSRWQHVFPRPSDMQIMKWKSLCSPAAVPLTTEYFPTKTQFEAEYQRQPYNVSQNIDDELTEEPKTRDELLRELISLRFSQGFQIVVGPAVAKAFGQKQLRIADIFSRESVLEDGTSVFMSVGNTIHQLSCVNGSDVEVNIFVRKPMGGALEEASDGQLSYRPAMRTLFDNTYETGEYDLVSPKPDRNWNFIDSFLAGHHDGLADHLRFWRARFVLIPMSSRHSSFPKTQNGDNDEEIRIEGIRKLAQMWQKHRYIPPDERRYQSVGGRRRRDMNPLDIVYKTDDPSVVIAAELETLPLIEGLEGANRKGQLVRSREQFQKKNFSLAALADAIQQPVESGGVRMQNRRWHLRLHYNCFIGSDMTSWLLENFEDLEDREEAEALGNRLMVSDEKDKDREGSKDAKRDGGGLFVHVEKRHPFRDGQYFYQITSDYAKPHPPGWFNSRRNLASVPSTPLTEHMPRDAARPPAPGLSRPTSIHEEGSPASGATTPTAAAPSAGGSKKPNVVLSKVIKYDVDHRKRSYRPEIVELHYDRLHNPDNCYHIRVDWMNVTAKLIEDAIESWAREAVLYGLRLVEVPIAEACSITEINPFRRPYLIRLALAPPEQQPVTYYDPTSFTPQTQPGRHFYQKAILRKFDFVLDVEAASNFPSTVNVTYSWGRPEFKYTQYIHRTGMVLAEITDDGDILLLANRLYSNRAATAREREAQKELRTTEPASTGMDRVGSGQGARTALGSYTPYGIAEPTPVASPSFKPTFLSPGASPATAFGTPGQLKSATATATPGGYTPQEPELIKDELESFCLDGPALDAFYKEQQIIERSTSGLGQATQPSTASAALTPGFGANGSGNNVEDKNIPVLGLPPTVLAAAAAAAANNRNSTFEPGPNSASFTPRVSSPALMSASQLFARRGSVQDGSYDIVYLGRGRGMGEVGQRKSEMLREEN
ncbi:vacuolar membrane-associated protein IML1 [Echria macrotheca]|uniref:Vacuolar membrane-associated protein IML1 n=1 Tax=Echria macrotheca TaxID=438768 RepID=A0AAJ0BNX0_9PEZI|nr:vacuolar membrane-associated protein IML1 [Echria macrotheca]